jgi:hypothetical protein
LLLRLMAQELRVKEERGEVSYRNTPGATPEYVMFRRVVSHLSAIQDHNQLHAEPLVYSRTWTIPGNAVTAEGFQTLEKSYFVTYNNKKGNTYTINQREVADYLNRHYGQPLATLPDTRDKTSLSRGIGCIIMHGDSTLTGKNHVDILARRCR